VKYTAKKFKFKQKRFLDCYLSQLNWYCAIAT